MNSTVERCELAPDLSISRVLTGLWQIADLERDGHELNLQKAAASMVPYVDEGLTTFDMADHYGSAEEIVGSYRMKWDPDSVQLFTKWVPKPGPVTRGEVRAAVQRSLDRLQTECLDMLQFHLGWNYADPSWLDSIYWLQELKEEGLIRYLGLTNVNTAHLRIVVNCGIDIVSNQVCFSLLDQRPLHGLTELCLRYGIKLLAYGTIAGGFLTERWLDKPEPDFDTLETWSQMKYKRFINQAGGWKVFQDVLHSVNNVARKYDVSMANVSCRYVLEQPAVGGIIIGARLGNSEHIKDNLRLFQFSLDETSRSEIENSLAKLQKIPGDSGDEYRTPPFLTATGDLSHHLDSIPPPYTSQRRPDGRSLVLSGTPWEEIAGYSRAVRQGNRIVVSGTTATHGDRVIGGADPAAQLHFVIDKIEGAIQSLGGRLEDVVRTRLFIKNMVDWEKIARVHGERFCKILPANTMVQCELIGEEYLVEMEAEAVVDVSGD